MQSDTGRVTATLNPRAPLRVAAAPPGGRTTIVTLSPLERRALVEQEDHRAAVKQLQTGVRIGLVIWVFFLVTDWVISEYVVPGRFWLFVMLRALGLGAGLLLLWFIKAPEVTPKRLAAIDIACFTSISTLITLMTFESGGITSPYAQGIVTGLIVRGFVLQTHWRAAALRLLGPTLAYPLVTLLASLLLPDVAAQFASAASRAHFLINLAFVAVTYCLSVASGHAMWALRMQVYASRAVGKYRLEQLLGRGGMGEVWSAEHVHLRRRVAVKLLRDVDASDPAVVARFERELRALADIQHPHVVKVFDGGVTADGLWFYAMELLEGEDLSSLVRRTGKLSPELALRLTTEAARGLAAAHARGIVHRDVKPENIFVVTSLDGPSAKVVDFGIAKLLDQDVDDSLTKTGAVLGTPLYIAPETARGGTIDERSDVYSLGCTLYFALTGAPPHDARGAARLIYAHLHDEPAAPSERVPSLPSELDPIVAKCLRKNPADRWASMEEFATALEGCRAAMTTMPSQQQEAS